MNNNNSATNTIKISGLIAPADLAWMREWLADGSATFPQDVDAALRMVDPSQDITLCIDSPGGYCDAGNTMIIALRDWERSTGRKVNVEVGAQAASMAACMMFSFSGTIKVHKNSVVMLHSARVELYGDTMVADMLRDMAESLDVINEIMIDAVATKTDRAHDEVATWIKGSKETFFGARKLMDQHLIDGVIDAAPSAMPVSPMALSSFSRLSACNKRDGGMLAAVAFASLNKEAVMADTEKKPEEEEPQETPAEDTPPADTEEKPEESPAEDEEKPAEEEETEESPAEDDEKPAEEDDAEASALEETIAAAVKEAVALALADANTEIATLKSKLEAAEMRAAKAEGTLKGITAARGKPLQLPNKTSPDTVADAKAEWQKAVRQYGLSAAMKKFPDLLAAVRSAAK